METDIQLTTGINTVPAGSNWELDDINGTGVISCNEFSVSADAIFAIYAASGNTVTVPSTANVSGISKSN